MFFTFFDGADLNHPNSIGQVRQFGLITAKNDLQVLAFDKVNLELAKSSWAGLTNRSDCDSK
jgi:hypothetical protein